MPAATAAPPCPASRSPPPGNGVKVLGWRNWPGRIPVAASNLYARNLLTFLTTFWDKDARAPKLPDDDADRAAPC